MLLKFYDSHCFNTYFIKKVRTYRLAKSEDQIATLRSTEFAALSRKNKLFLVKIKTLIEFVLCFQASGSQDQVQISFSCQVIFNKEHTQKKFFELKIK